MTPSSKTAFAKRITGDTGILPNGYFDQSQGKANGEAVEQMAATGFDFELLPNGDVLIDFFGDDGVTLNLQVITRDCLARFPVVVHAFVLAVDKGTDEALQFLNAINSNESRQP